MFDMFQWGRFCMLPWLSPSPASSSSAEGTISPDIAMHTHTHTHKHHKQEVEKALVYPICSFSMASSQNFGIRCLDSSRCLGQGCNAACREFQIQVQSKVSDHVILVERK